MVIKKSTYLVVAYVVVLHLVAFALMDKVEAIPKIVNKIGMTVSVGSQFDVILHDHTGVVLLGDSHTWLLGRNDGQHNQGVSGIMVADVPGTMPANIARASAILLMIGTNDIWRGKTAGLPERLDHLAAAESEAPRCGGTTRADCVRPRIDERQGPLGIRTPSRCLAACIKANSLNASALIRRPNA